MARPPRLELPGVPLHITQWGVNRCAVFLDDDDRHDYLRLLGLFAKQNALGKKGPGQIKSAIAAT